MKINGFLYKIGKRNGREGGGKKTKKLVAACDSCDIRRIPVKGEGSWDARIVLIGRNPGKQEELEGRPFVGPAGSVLRSVLTGLGVDMEDVYITNVVKCHTLDDAEPSSVAVRCCAPLLVEELEKLKNRKVIIALGDTAASWFGLRSGVVKLRGFIHKTKYGPVCVTYHPSYVLRSYGAKDVMGYDSLYYFTVDIKNALDFVKTGMPYRDMWKDRIKVVEDEKGMMELERYVENIDKSTLVGVDFETSSLDIYGTARLLSVAFCFGDDLCWVVPVGWLEDSLVNRLKGLCDYICKNFTLCMYNAMFDMRVGKNYVSEEFASAKVEDPYVLFYLLQGGERTVSSLKRLAMDYLRVGDYSVDVENIEKVELDDLVLYNAYDAMSTVELYKYFCSKVDEGIVNVYEKVIKSAQKLLVEIMSNGIAVVPDYVVSFQEEVNLKLDSLKRYFQERWGNVNLNSPKQVLEVLKRLGAQVDSTNKEVLEGLRGRFEFVDKLLEYRELQTLYSRYVVPFIAEHVKGDGLVHAEFSLTQTATGRTSCSNPNLQNIPEKTASYIKKMFVSRWKDGCILDADFSQQELRVAAMHSGDPYLIEIFERGDDLHDMVARRLGLYKSESAEDIKEGRRVAKAFNFGIIYGRGPDSISQELGVTFEEAEKIRQEYFQMFPGLARWIEEQRRFVERNGFVRSLFGRIRYLPGAKSTDLAIREEAFRKAINTPIQADASDIALLGACNVMVELKRRGLRSLLVNFVHDEFLIDVYPGELDEVIEIVKEKAVQVEVPTKYFVPLVVDVSYGKSWGDCEK